MVALFEADSLERITGAVVTARVAEIGMAGTEETLEPMTVSDAITYGNFFRLTSSALYKVTLEIILPGSQDVIPAEFSFRHNM